ncbi:MAG: hypothetical protein HY699_12090 [Deltaproteobacteria bacterium]|nr:hypothetical protein [Deltaproteobacteria bacterium]
MPRSKRDNKRKPAPRRQTHQASPRVAATGNGEIGRLNETWRQLLRGGYQSRFKRKPDDKPRARPCEVDLGSRIASLTLVDKNWEVVKENSSLALPPGAHEPNLKYEFLSRPVKRTVLRAKKQDGGKVCLQHCTITEHKHTLAPRH